MLNSMESAMSKPLAAKDQFLSPPPLLRLPSSFPPPTSLADFSSLQLLGSGTFAKVHQGVLKISGETFAVKQITKYLIKKERMIPQVQLEVDILYKLNHPNIIKLYTHFEDEESIYLVLEYADQGTLLDLMRKQEKGHLSIAQAKYYFQQLLSSFSFLHSFSPPIIHRDIKPENVLLLSPPSLLPPNSSAFPSSSNSDPLLLRQVASAPSSNSSSLPFSNLSTSSSSSSSSSFICKLADFGSANAKDNTRTFCGTLIYMAPEMIRKEIYDTSIDIWSLGVLFYEIVTGKSPFTVNSNESQDNPIESQKSLTQNILEQKVDYPKDFPILLKDLISKMLNKDPKKRIKLAEIKEHEFFKAEEEEKKESQVHADESPLLHLSKIRARPLSEILEEFKKNRPLGSTKLIEDLNKELLALKDQIMELKSSYGLQQNKMAKLEEIKTKMEKEDGKEKEGIEGEDGKDKIMNRDAQVIEGREKEEIGGFIAFVESLRKREKRRDELLRKKTEKWEELKRQNTLLQELDFEILKNRQIFDEISKVKVKNQELIQKQAKILFEKKDLLEENEEAESKSEKESKIKEGSGEKEARKEGNDEVEEREGGGIELLEHFFRKAKFLLEQKKKIQLLNNKRSDSKYNEMQKELREINMELSKRKEEIDQQIGEEFEFANEMINNELEQEKKGKEEDFNMTKKILERKINNLQIENYSISSKISFIEATFIPRLETLKQIIAQYEKNKLDLKNMIGKLEMKINEFKNLMDEQRNQIDEGNSAKKSKGNFLGLGLFQKDKKSKDKKDKEKKEKEKEKKDRKSEN